MKLEYISCNFCKKDTTRYIGKRVNPDGSAQRELDIVQRSFCGLIYPNPMPRLGDITELDLPDEYLDVVSLNSVIQYVQDPLGTLKKIYSLLKKSGLTGNGHLIYCIVKKE